MHLSSVRATSWTITPGCFLERSWQRWDRLQGFFARHATINLVHNRENAREAERWHARTFVFPSLPPLDLPALAGPRPPGRKGAAPGAQRVVYICSFKSDEPFDTFFAAAKDLPSVEFFVTGRPPEKLHSDLPTNVQLTGFLREKDYLALLISADLIVALTTRGGTLLYGAQEAIALAKPLLLSACRRSRRTSAAAPSSPRTSRNRFEKASDRRSRGGTSYLFVWAPFETAALPKAKSASTSCAALWPPGRRSRRNFDPPGGNPRRPATFGAQRARCRLTCCLQPENLHDLDVDLDSREIQLCEGLDEAVERIRDVFTSSSPFSVLPLAGLKALFTLAAALALSPTSRIDAQITVSGLTDQTVYADHVSFTVPPTAGVTTVAALDGVEIPTGQLYDVDNPDYHELSVEQFNGGPDPVASVVIQFIVRSSERADSEWGLPPWVPYPSIPFRGRRVRGLSPASHGSGVVPAGPEDPGGPSGCWTMRPEARWRERARRVGCAFRRRGFPPARSGLRAPPGGIAGRRR
jgi:hypothetical protein